MDLPAPGSTYKGADRLDTGGHGIGPMDRGRHGVHYIHRQGYIGTGESAAVKEERVVLRCARGGGRGLQWDAATDIGKKQQTGESRHADYEGCIQRKKRISTRRNMH